MKKLMLPTLSALAIALVAACQPPPASGNAELLNQMAKDIETIKKDVAAIKKGGGARAKPRRRKPKPQTSAYNIPVQDSPVLGKKGAPVTVTVFSDYQCPFCSRVDPMLHQVVKDPELKDKVKVVFKHFPLSFHKNARPAAKAALAAGEQGKFWEMSEKLYANQKALTESNFKKWAGEIGLDVQRFESDMKNNDAKYEAMIKRDMALGTKEARVRGTPSLYVNGWMLKQRSVQGVKDLIKDKNLL